MSDQKTSSAAWRSLKNGSSRCLYSGLAAVLLPKSLVLELEMDINSKICIPYSAYKKYKSTLLRRHSSILGFPHGIKVSDTFSSKSGLQRKKNLLKLVKYKKEKPKRFFENDKLRTSALMLYTFNMVHDIEILH